MEQNSENKKLIEGFLGFDPPAFGGEYLLLFTIVEKIESLGYATIIRGSKNRHLMNVLSSHITNDGEEILSTIKELSHLVETLYPTKKEAIYSSCIEFIKWYNSKIESLINL